MNINNSSNRYNNICRCNNRIMISYFSMSNTKNYKNLIQMWERQTNKQTKTKYSVKQNKGTIIKQNKATNYYMILIIII